MMDQSDNLISLSMSDSGLGAPTPFSSVSAASNNWEGETGGTIQSSYSSGDPFEAVAAAAPAVNNWNTDAEVGDTGMLIDWEDEIQVPLSQAILTKAEVDDTFGVFSQAQKSSQRLEKVASLRSDDDTALKLVRSFTSGRKSDPKVAANKEASQAAIPSVTVSEGENHLNNTEKKVVDEQERQSNQSKDDSFASCLSDQPTIVEDDIGDLPVLQNGSGIGDGKMDLGRNLSTGSDSEFLDINNLSSFSFPDGDMDENEYLKNIHREDMACSTSALVKKIKLEMMQDEDKSDEVSNCRDSGDHLSDVTCPTLNSTSSTTRSRLSSTCSVSSVSTESGARLRNRLSTASSISDCSMTMGSPIRASYPFTKFMPTPNARTPRTPCNDRISRDRLTESLLSPSRMRVFVQTGDVQISPSRVPLPVRKSISAETLHFPQSPSRIGRQPQVKFSTPTASRPRNRYSFNIVQEEDPTPLERNITFVSSDNGGNVVDPSIGSNATFTRAEIWKVPRLDKVSYSSTSSCGSSALASPSSSSFIKREREISLLSKQMMKVNIEHPTSNAARNGVQPLRATAIVPPNTLNKVAEPSTSKANPFRTKPSTSSTVTTSSGQRKFVPPVAASSPKLAPSPARPTRPAANQITPSRSRYAVNARSSGYGQQNLNATFEAKEPLKSPNKVTSQPPAQKATVKQPALPTKSLKGGLPSLGARTRTTTAEKDGDQPSTKSGTQSGFLRRPAATSGSTASVNKENNARGLTRFGYPSRPPPRQQ